MLDRQIDAILGQTIPVEPHNIHVWYNWAEGFSPSPAPAEQNVKTYYSSWNTKFFGRFTLPFLCRTPYIAIFDDDNIPEARWLENCLTVINTPETNGILGGVGVIMKNTKKKSLRKNEKPLYRIGWNGWHLDHTERVDYVGQTWFFRKEWAKYMWYEEPRNWDNGEDIMFCYLAQKYGGINCFVPPHPDDNTELWSTDYNTAWREGRDENASWRLAGHREVRESIMWHCIDNGWKTVHEVTR